jgi:AcrR family transcriptional regulator
MTQRADARSGSPGRVDRAGGARERLLAAALDLYAVHGVEATTLQMIADELGVTKAAVYHQFHAKDDIVLALVEPVIDELAAVVAAGEGRTGRAARTEAAIGGIIDVAVSHRRLAALLHSDPVVGALMADHPGFASTIERIGLLMHGPDPDDEARVVSAMFGSAVMMATRDPALADIDDETLRRHLLATARRMLKLRARP